MVQKHLHPVLTVPELDGRSSTIRSGSARDPLRLFRAVVPTVLVASGIAATLAWMGFLAWTAFELLRSALG